MTADGYALLVVDMQNGFCHPEGSFPRIGRGLEGAMDAVANAAVAVGQARRAGVPVVFTRHVYRPGRPDEGAALIGNSPELAGVSGLAASLHHGLRQRGHARRLGNLQRQLCGLPQGFRSRRK